MSKIAIIKTGGKQYKVKEGQLLKVEKLDNPAGSTVELDTLLVADTDGSNVEIGKPSLGGKVSAEIMHEGKGKKVVVVKYKNKTHYKKTTGHRQMFTAIKIAKIA